MTELDVAVVEAVAQALWDTRFHPGHWKSYAGEGSKQAERRQARAAIETYRQAVQPKGGVMTYGQQQQQQGQRVRVKKTSDVGNALWGKTGRITQTEGDKVRVELDEPLGGERRFKLNRDWVEIIY